MSMTREEAINIIENKIQIDVRFCTKEEVEQYQEALYMALSALRPVSRERVEKAWRGEWVEDPYSTKSERNRIIHSKKCICSVCNKSNGRKKENFCPACGVPMTDEAVEMVIRRLEEMRNG